MVFSETKCITNLSHQNSLASWLKVIFHIHLILLIWQDRWAQTLTDLWPETQNKINRPCNELQYSLMVMLLQNFNSVWVEYFTSFITHQVLYWGSRMFLTVRPESLSSREGQWAQTRAPADKCSTSVWGQPALISFGTGAPCRFNWSGQR